MNRVSAPWTKDQVNSLNDFQKSGLFHEYTYGEGLNKVNLIATEQGWVTVEGGPVVQDWAYETELNWSWKKVSPWI